MAGKGKFFWYELVTPNAEAALRFYGDVVGWTPQALGGPHSGYTLLNAGDTAIGGVMGLTEEMCQSGAQPGWLGYIQVADTDAAAESIKAAGGTVCRAPDDIPEVGRFAVIADPAGAMFAILAPTPREGVSPPPPVSMDQGKVGWHELMTGQGGAAAMDFYAGQFGWTPSTEMDMGAMGKYRLYAVDRVDTGAMMDKPAEMPVSAWSFYFNVDAIDAAGERVKAGGGQIIMGPMEVPGGSWIINGIDPQGAHFALVAPKR